MSVGALGAVAVAALVTGALIARVPPATAGGPALAIGVVDNGVERPTSAATRARLELVRRVGFDTIGVTETWTLGQTVPPERGVRTLRNVVASAGALGMHVILSVFPSGSPDTPLTPVADGQFAAFTVALVRETGVREVSIGNEPNLNRFWLPQFALDGSDAAAPAYLSLLARTYDALKAYDPGIVVDGGALSPRGGDRPAGRRPTHSPTSFIQDLGLAYKDSGRKRPIMDAFDIHPYEDNSSLPPTTLHPNSTAIGIADYGKLVALLGGAFDGTSQPGSTLPIVYGEFGVETRVPPGKAALYTGTEPATTRPVDAITQGRYYQRAIALAFCQPNVRTILLYHAFDESNLAGWQSGVYYADGTPKPSLALVHGAIERARRGIIAHCPGLHLTPGVRRVVWPAPSLAAGRPLAFRLACAIDCAYTARLESTRGRTVAVRHGRLVAGRLASIRLVFRARPGTYEVRVTLAAPVDPGRPEVRMSPPFEVVRAAALNGGMSERMTTGSSVGRVAGPAASFQQRIPIESART
jgi:hypothetical protein